MVVVKKKNVLDSLRVTRILTQGDGRRRSDSVGHIVPSPSSGRLEKTSVSSSREDFLRTQKDIPGSRLCKWARRRSSTQCS